MEPSTWYSVTLWHAQSQSWWAEKCASGKLGSIFETMDSREELRRPLLDGRSWELRVRVWCLFSVFFSTKTDQSPKKIYALGAPQWNLSYDCTYVKDSDVVGVDVECNTYQCNHQMICSDDLSQFYINKQRCLNYFTWVWQQPGFLWTSQAHPVYCQASHSSRGQIFFRFKM